MLFLYHGEEPIMRPSCAATCRNNRVHFSFELQFSQKEENELYSFNTLVTLVYALHYFIFTARPAMG